jgi:hypothetical protein
MTLLIQIVGAGGRRVVDPGTVNYRYRYSHHFIYSLVHLLQALFYSTQYLSIDTVCTVHVVVTLYAVKNKEKDTSSIGAGV